MNDIAIRFDHVGKLYKLGLVGTGTLSHDLNRWWKTTILRQEDPYLKIGETNDRSKKGASEYVWALKDITFDVHQGDVVGIIGKNGAGKSTLLKLLSRVTSPTTGAIRARSRIASLQESVPVSIRADRPWEHLHERLHHGHDSPRNLPQVGRDSRLCRCGDAI